MGRFLFLNKSYFVTGIYPKRDISWMMGGGGGLRLDKNRFMNYNLS